MQDRTETGATLKLSAKTAGELMTANPFSIHQNAGVGEALALLIDKGISAAPVIDDAGRPVGVLSQSDLLIHERETADFLRKTPEFCHKAELRTSASEPVGKGFQAERLDHTRVHDLMTPGVFSVAPGDSGVKVVRDLLTLKVHRLFVVEGNGVLVGVISAFDILRHLST